MSAKEVLAYAAAAAKGGWRQYSACKRLMGEELAEAEYRRFISDLCRILKV